MVRGWAMSLRQASQAASMISSSVLKTRFESQVWRRYCQMFSTGFSSGARDGSRMMVMLFGMLRAPVVCQPAVEQQRGMGAPFDGAGDRVEVELHGLRVGEGQRQGGTRAAGRADGPEQVRAFVALVGRLSRPCSAPRPLPHEAVLLADAGLVLEPDLDGLARREAAQMGSQRGRKVFLNASIVRGSWAG